jgi:hypothetical protein
MGATPIFYACSYGLPNVGDILIKYKADLDIYNYNKNVKYLKIC